MTHSETCPVCNRATRPAGSDAKPPAPLHATHDCAQVERDCLDLHKALTETWRALLAVQTAITKGEMFPDGSPMWQIPIVEENLVRAAIEAAGVVLDRTSRTVA